MKRICHATESDDTYTHAMRQTQADTVHDDVSDAIASAAFTVAVDIEAKAIVTYTTSGSTAIRMARKRPNVPILCLTPDQSTARRLTVSYGVHAVFAGNIKGNFSGPASTASQTLKKRGLAKGGDRFVMTAGVPFGVPGTTNFLRVAEVDH
jgi:pyruvate kinase